jgi:hypothetical protein
MSTITVDLEGFKRLTGEFLKAIDSANIESLDNGWKCLGLAYFGIEPCPLPGSYEEIMAVSLLKYAGGKYVQREWELSK